MRKYSKWALVAVPLVALVVAAVGVALLSSINSASAAPGDHLWSKRFGDASGEIVHGVTADGAGNVLVTGQFQGSMDFGGGGQYSGTTP
jgi:hypothetical protein